MWLDQISIMGLDMDLLTISERLSIRDGGDYRGVVYLNNPYAYDNSPYLIAGLRNGYYYIIDLVGNVKHRDWSMKLYSARDENGINNIHSARIFRSKNPHTTGEGNIYRILWSTDPDLPIKKVPLIWKKISRSCKTKRIIT